MFEVQLRRKEVYQSGNSGRPHTVGPRVHLNLRSVNLIKFKIYENLVDVLLEKFQT